MASVAGLTRNNPKLKEVHGLEVTNRLTYHEWEPGGSYTKSLLLKNVKMKTQKIKFSISSQNFFCEATQRPVVLSAGNTVALPVTFKPNGKSEITDKVEICTLEGRFTIPLIATLPKPKLSLPTSIQLGLCEVQGEVNVSFNINNSGLVSTSFYWECKPPFKINPTNGTLPPRGSLKLQVSFRPSVACVYRNTATCHYGDQYTKTMLIEGIGKYPHLLVKESPLTCSECGNADEVILSYGEVPLGTEMDKSINLYNVSPVAASFSIVPETRSHSQESMFRCLKTKGTVPPLGNLSVKILCAPDFTEQCAISCFILELKGGVAKTKITCNAQPVGPKVMLDKECVNFGYIECGTTSFAYLHLINHSPTASTYQFQIDPHSVFEVNNPTGEIKGGGQARVTVKVVFNPHRPMPYHRAVTCLVLNQEPLVVHFIGSAFSETVKPVSLSQQQVSLYRSLALSGLSKYPPKYLLECVENGSLHITEDGSLILDKVFHPPIDELLPTAGAASPSNSPPQFNYFQLGSDMYFSRHFLMEADEMQFGFVSPHKSSEGKILTITNLTHGTVVCSWLTGRDDEFQVVPRDRELPPQSTAAFAVSFWPKERNNLFCRELECYIYYKALSDATLVDTRVLIPPWCLTVTATGHSFPPDIEPFQPIVAFDSNKLVLPDSLPNRPSYRRFLVHSKCDTPTLYSFENNSAQVFHVKPSHGVIMGRSYRVLVAEFLAPASQCHNESIKCTFNSNPKFTKTLQLTGISESPELLLNREGSMFFKPTCVGGSSKSIVKITNPCGLPLRFAWQVKGPVNRCLRITPRAGMLQPNECVSATFLFTPLEIKKYHFPTVVTSLLSTDNCSSDAKCRVPLCVYGEGTMGTIKCIDSEINCGHITIGTSLKVNLVLKNTSCCSLRIRIGTRQKIDTLNEETEEISSHDKSHGLEFDFRECVIEPLSDVILPVTLRPAKTSTYVSHVFYQCILTNNEVDETCHDLCTITVTGAYPTLSVIDVQGDGAASSLSKSQIWKMLQLSSINHHLCEEPSLSELRYTISTRHSTTRRAPVLTRAILDFNFCPGSLNDKPHTTYFLMIENPGQIETEWAFKFPMDMYMEPEFWAESGRIDPVEQHEYDVVKNSIFSIMPKDGTLEPGERVMVKLSYSHFYLGTNRLPVLLKINRGREIMLNFTGITSPPLTPCVTLTSNTHSFAPMPLDMLTYPIQVFELYNAGDAAGTYIIDTSPLDELRVLNYGNTILECLNPQGNLPPKQTAKIDFIFSPLEAKTYTVDLAIHFTDGHTQVVTFIGEGVLSDQRDIAPSTCSRPKTVDDYVPLSTSPAASPCQLVKLSQDKLVLGDTPLFAVVQCIVFMRNISSSTISYNWDLKNNEVVSIHPSTGYIQPGKSAQLRVTFHSESHPVLYNMDIMCFITDESEMKTYKQELLQFGKVDVKRSEEFIITDKRSFTKQLPETSEETYEEWMKKDMSKKSKTRVRKRENKLREPPIEPQPSILHLGIAANTYSIPDYCRLHGNKFDSFNMDYNSIMTRAVPVERSGTDDTPRSVMVSATEMSIVENTLVECLRDLQKDTNFLKSLQAIARERVPYFSQFTTKQPLAAEIDMSIKENASRHIYAAGLEHIPVLAECTELSVSVAMDHSNYEEHKEENESRSSGMSVGLPRPSPPIANLKDSDTVGMKIKRLTEFQSFTELVLENVLLNVIKEVNKGETSLTAPVYTIAKPPG